MPVRNTLTRLPVYLMLATLAAACGREPTGSTGATARLGAANEASLVRADASSESRDLATLRSATARFHRYSVAADADYTFLFMNMCMVDTSIDPRGGMGYHYVNTGLLDGAVQVEAPEALLYERGEGGDLKLIGVEYVIPQAAWTSPTPPRLFGRDFKLNGFGLWALHVWIWKDNPTGLYADWNPRVSCPGANGRAAGRGHPHS